jgi:hypothetical protein
MYYVMDCCPSPIFNILQSDTEPTESIVYDRIRVIDY